MTVAALLQKIQSFPENLRPPLKCIHCLTELVLDEHWPFCPNFHCSERVFGRLQKFVDVLDMKGAGEETLKALARRGVVKTPADFFRVTVQQFQELDRKGEKHFEKFRIGLESVKSLRTAEIFASLDIEGRGTWEAITAVPGLQTPEQILQQAEAQNINLFAKARMVTPDRAKTIIIKVNEVRSEILDLLSFIQAKQAGTKLLGIVFCLTGALSRPRPKIEADIKNAGGTVASSVSSRVKYLVTDDPTSSSAKNKKAREVGVQVVNEEFLKNLLES